jgi:hypothetical protein
MVIDEAAIKHICWVCDSAAVVQGNADRETVIARSPCDEAIQFFLRFSASGLPCRFAPRNDGGDAGDYR